MKYLISKEIGENEHGDIEYTLNQVVCEPCLNELEKSGWEISEANWAGDNECDECLSKKRKGVQKCK